MLLFKNCRSNSRPLILAGFLFSWSQLAAAAGPAQVKWSIVEAGGNGCTDRTKVSVMESKANEIKLAVPNLSVDWKGQQSQANVKAFCKVDFRAEFAGKWRYAIEKISLKTKAILGPDAHGQLVTAYTHKESGKTAGKTSYLEGESLRQGNDVGVELQKEWSECGNPKGLSVVVGGGFAKDQNVKAAGLSTVEVSGPVTILVAWEKCE